MGTKIIHIFNITPSFIYEKKKFYTELFVLI